jgi:2,3-bisphosphoglycerate-dependent phosphoglycerate mutase
MHLFLIRHAQSQNNALPEELRVEDPGLTTLGQEQARRLGGWILDLGLTRIITSPFRRSLQTAAALQRTTALAPEVRTALHEIGGCYSGHPGTTIVGRPGMTRIQIEGEFPGFRVSPEIDGQGWWGCKPRETEVEAIVRAERLLKQTIDEFARTGERIALVMHADFKVALLRQFHFAPLATPYNTSVTAVAVEASVPRVIDYNSVRHLPAELVTI